MIVLGDRPADIQGVLAAVNDLFGGTDGQILRLVANVERCIGIAGELATTGPGPRAGLRPRVHRSLVESGRGQAVRDTSLGGQGAAHAIAVADLPSRLERTGHNEVLLMCVVVLGRSGGRPSGCRCYERERGNPGGQNRGDLHIGSHVLGEVARKSLRASPELRGSAGGIRRHRWPVAMARRVHYCRIVFAFCCSFGTSALRHPQTTSICKAIWILRPITHEDNKHAYIKLWPIRRGPYVVDHRVRRPSQTSPQRDHPRVRRTGPQSSPGTAAEGRESTEPCTPKYDTSSRRPSYLIANFCEGSAVLVEVTPAFCAVS